MSTQLPSVPPMNVPPMVAAAGGFDPSSDVYNRLL